VIQASGTHVFTVPLPLEEGGLLSGAQVAYSIYGQPSDENAVVLLHDLSHSHLAAGPEEDGDFRAAGWARELIGPGRPLDPEQLAIIVPNLLGSPFGSTSPVTVDPTSGAPMGAGLPDLSVLDMARAVSALLRVLEVRRVRALVGVGLGGQVALRLAALFPELAAGVVTLGAAHSLPETLREKLGLTRQVLWMDPEFKGGRYAPGQPPRRTLRKLRLEYLRLLHGRDHPSAPTESALEAEAEAFASTFDANAWALLCSAYVACDLSENLAEIQARTLLIAGATDALAPPARVRDTYHRLSAAGVRARYHELPGTGDHGALLTDAQRLHGPLRDFLRRP
jgi:homoserine O-acetyltransferase